ncbi:hypothetical protein DH2020_005554 [Rehmannia glutinosa]|uniref:Uncharacterized protein n=1 Tax=Rehmannia glutinosa TaxID=99300 RepID=A0ABR0XGG7_REHGL
MGNRRFVPTSDDEDDAPLPPRRNSNGEESKKRKRKGGSRVVRGERRTKAQRAPLAPSERGVARGAS